MKAKTLMAAFVVAGAVGFVGTAFAQNAPQSQKEQGAGAGAALRQPGGAVTMTATGTARVKSVDRAKRTVTLERPDGTVATYQCGKNMVNFDQIKEGDELKATMIERVAVSVGKGGPAEAGEAGMVALAPKGDKPGVILANTEVRQFKVDSIDAAGRTVTMTGPSGKSETIKVGQDVDLSGVKKGDDVTVRYTEGLALVDEKGAAPGEAQPAAARVQGAGALDTTTMSATVESVDPATRTITVRAANGQGRYIHLGKDVRNFDQIQPGDKVRATLAEEMAVQVTKGGAPAPAGEGAVMVRTPEGAKPGMLIAETEAMSGKIDSVDPEKRMILLTDEDGKPRKVKAGPQVDLSQLKAGDEVNARVTQALAIVVEKP